MTRNINIDEIPEPTIDIPAGIYEMVVESIVEDRSKKGKLMYTATFRIAEGEVKDLPMFERFTIGTDADPDALNEETWRTNFAAKRLGQMFRACGVTGAGDTDALIARAVQQHLVGVVTQTVDDGAADPRYKGQVRSNIQRFYPLADRPAPRGAPTVVTGRPAAVPPATPAKPAAPRTAQVIQTVPCGYCGERVPRAAYAKHVEEHETVVPSGGEAGGTA